VVVQNSSRSVLVWSIRTKQSINSKLHLMPRKSEFLLWKIPGALSLIQFVEWISAQSWVMLWTPHFIVSFFVVVLGGVVFRFPDNLEKNLNNSVRKSYFLTFWLNLHWCFIMEQEVYWFLRSNYKFKKTQKVWSIRTKQSINSKLHLMPRKS
jgi:hypothetical protein